MCGLWSRRPRVRVPSPTPGACKDTSRAVSARRARPSATPTLRKSVMAPCRFESLDEAPQQLVSRSRQALGERAARGVDCIGGCLVGESKVRSADGEGNGILGLDQRLGGIDACEVKLAPGPG